MPDGGSVHVEIDWVLGQSGGRSRFIMPAYRAGIDVFMKDHQEGLPI